MFSSFHFIRAHVCTYVTSDSVKSAKFWLLWIGHTCLSQHVCVIRQHRTQQARIFKFLIKKKSREIDQETFPTPKSLLLTYKLKPSVPCCMCIVFAGFAAYRYLNCMQTICVITTIRVSLKKFTFKIKKYYDAIVNKIICPRPM